MTAVSNAYTALRQLLLRCLKDLVEISVFEVLEPIF